MNIYHKYHTNYDCQTFFDKNKFIQKIAILISLIIVKFYIFFIRVSH